MHPWDPWETLAFIHLFYIFHSKTAEIPGNEPFHTSPPPLHKMYKHEGEQWLTVSPRQLISGDIPAIIR